MDQSRVAVASQPDALRRKGKTTKRRRIGVSLSSHLLVLVAAIALPLIALSSGIIWMQFHTQRAQAEALLVDQARVLARVVDDRFSHTIQIARVLASSSPIIHADMLSSLNEIIAAGNMLAADLPPGADPSEIVLLDQDGRSLADNKPALQRQYQPFPKMLDAIASGRTELTDLIVDESSRNAFVALVVPVHADPLLGDTRPIAAVAILVPSRQITAIIAAARPTGGEVASVQDRAGITIARTTHADETVGRLPVPTVLKAIMSAESGLAARATRAVDGVVSTIAFAHAPQSGFAVKLLVPEDQFLAPLRTAAREAAIIGVAVLAFGLGLALFYVRRIVNAFRQALPQPADRLHPLAPLPRTGLREADDLAAAFRAILAESEASLRNQQRSDATARTLFEQTPVGVLVAEPGGRVTSANDAFLAITGHTRADLEAGAIRWNGATRSSPHKSPAADANTPGHVLPHEDEYVRPDGTRVPVLLSSGTIDHATGLTATFVVDLSDRHAAAAALKGSEERYKALSAATLDGIIIHDNGHIIESNDAFCRLFGYAERDEIIGRNALTLVIPDHRATVAAGIQRGVSEPQEIVAVRVDGSTFPVEIQGYPILYRGQMLQVAIARDLTRQKAAEAALRDSESRYRALSSGTNEGVLIHADGRILDVNQAYLRMHGCGRDEDVSGKHPLTFIAPAERSRIRAKVAEEFSEPYETVGQKADGTTFPVEYHGHAISYQGRRVRITIAHDLTRQKAAEAALRESEARFRMLAEATQDGVVIHDNSTIVDVNEMYWRIFGFTAQAEVIGRNILDMVAPQDRAEVASRLANGQTGAYECTGRRADGGTVPLEAYGHSVEYQGRPMRVAVVRNVAYRKAAETALRESEANFRMLADSMPQMVWSARPDGYNDYFNARFYSFAGLPDAARAAEDWKSIVHPEDLSDLTKKWSESLHTGRPFEAECRLRRHDGVFRRTLVRAVPLRNLADGSVVRWFGTNTDITEIVEAREYLARSQAELEALVEARTQALSDAERRLAHAERMKALGQLAGGIAHDFNNVLQTVQGAGALIERRPETPADIKRLSQLILQAAERGAAITHRLLAFSRRSDLQTEAVDPGQMLHGMRDILAYTLGAGIEIEVVVPDNLPPLLADKAQLETVLINLATNARDAMAGFGKLTLSAKLEVWSQSGQNDVLLEAGRYVRLSVTDTGIGMDSETLARVTEPFFTTKPPGAGTGLGLAMAHGFAEQSGGRIHLSSTPGVGTTVSLYLPLAEPDTETSAAENRTYPLSDRKDVRLLLVDDDVMVRDVLAGQIAAAGLTVSAFESGDAALDYIDRGEDVDVLVSDLSMPRMDGPLLIREAKRRRPGLPAILLTGFATNASELNVRSGPTDDFTLLRKPIDGESLAKRAVALLEETSH